MLDAGGISGGTKWWSLRVPEMWAMIESHDGAAHEQLIGAWKRSYELVMQHISGVQRYRESLAAAWPPERSPASQAYMQRLDALLASLWDTYEAAVENHRALAGATGALNSARQRMEEIQREHAANEVRLAGYQEELRTYQLAPSKGKGVPPQSPVADGRQAELEEQARRVMSSLSSELALAQVSIIQPKPYKPPLAKDGDDEPFPPKSEADFGLPITAASITPPGGSGRVSQPSSTTPPPNSARPGNGSPLKPGKPGPILGEANPPDSSPPPGGPIPPTTNDGRLTPSNPASAPPLGTIPTSGGRNPIGSPGRPPAGYESPARATSGAQPKNYAPPSNSVIGSIPGGRATPSTSPSRTPQRVNPVGGMIGQPGSAARSARRSDEAKLERNRDNAWVVANGVDPVILPPREKKIDPGPAIGLD